MPVGAIHFFPTPRSMNMVRMAGVYILRLDTELATRLRALESLLIYYDPRRSVVTGVFFTAYPSINAALNKPASYRG